MLKNSLNIQNKVIFRMIIILLTVSFMLSCSTISSFATSQSNISLNLTDATLYTFNTSYDVETQTTTPSVKMPEEYPDSIQLSFDGVDNPADVTWSVYIGADTIRVDNTGFVSLYHTTYYYYRVPGGYIKTTAEKTDGSKPFKITEEHRYRDCTVKAIVRNVGVYYAKIKVKNYIIDNADLVIDNYIKNNIPSSWNTYNKVNAICKYAASFDYSSKYSSYVSMINYGAGDCWASTSLIINMCEKMGIEASLRYAADDLGASSNHRNALINIDGDLYVADAGYDGNGPRPYDLYKLENGFNFKNYGDGVSFYQYDGDETNLVIPATYNNKKVVDISDSILFYNQTNKNVLVSSVSIPSTVKSISEFAFSDSRGLTSINVDSKNPYYKDINGVLYSKNGNNLLYYPNALSGSYVVPDTTIVIDKYSFYYSKNLTSVSMAFGVKRIEEGAFGDCTSLEEVLLSDTVESIGDYAFANDKKLEKIFIPKSVTTISENAFSNSSPVIYGYKGSFAEKYAQTKGLSFVDLSQYKKGDVNYDGSIDIFDYTYLQICIDYNLDLSFVERKFMDINDDGKITIIDANLLRLKTIGYDVF